MKVKIYTYPQETETGRHSKIFDYVVVEVPLRFMSEIDSLAVKMDAQISARNVAWSGAGAGFGVRDHSFRVRKTYFNNFVRKLQRGFPKAKVQTVDRREKA